MKDPDDTRSATTTLSPTPAGGDQELVLAVVAGLAGSSCCVIQLLINAFSEIGVSFFVGCAGFNKVLGPIRGYVRSLTLAYFVYKWYQKVSKKSSARCCNTRHLILYSIMCLGLTLMPEALLQVAELTKTSGLAIAPSTTNLERRAFTVDGMGCEACVTHVRRIVEGFDGVVGVEFIDLDTGRMDVWVNNEWNFVEEKLDAKLDSQGYILLPAGSTTQSMEWNSAIDSSADRSNEL